MTTPARHHVHLAANVAGIAHAKNVPNGKTGRVAEATRKAGRNAANANPEAVARNAAAALNDPTTIAAAKNVEAVKNAVAGSEAGKIVAGERNDPPPVANAPNARAERNVPSVQNALNVETVLNAGNEPNVLSAVSVRSGVDGKNAAGRKSAANANRARAAKTDRLAKNGLRARSDPLAKNVPQGKNGLAKRVRRKSVGLVWLRSSGKFPPGKTRSATWPSRHPQKIRRAGRKAAPAVHATAVVLPAAGNPGRRAGRMLGASSRPRR
jgi:hypothetical protein